MGAVTAICSAFISFFVLVAAEQKIITAETGQDVNLTCRAPNSNILVLEWSRADLGSEYVLLYRDGRLEPDHQHPSFKDRVDLQDRQMKDGDVSVILKNVTINDEGTYECRVFITKENSPPELISTIYLRVSAPPGPPGGTSEDGGSAGLIAGLSLCVLLLAAVCFVIYRKHKGQSRGSSQSRTLKCIYR